MFLIRLLAVSTFVLALASSNGHAAEFFGENLVDVKIALPKGDSYVRGTSDPVEGLLVNITLTNLSEKENLATETLTKNEIKRFTPEQIAELEKIEDPAKKLEAGEEMRKKAKETRELPPTRPINLKSLGVSYVEPQLGPHDVVDFVITRLPEEGEVVPENAKPVIIPRDNKPDLIARVDLTEAKYLAAGESSPVYSLEVGKFYQIREPGLYSVKARMRLIGNNQKPMAVAESNEEKFRVLPFKVVDQKIDELQRNWEFYERGVPAFAYHVYQVKTSLPNDEVYYVQRMKVRGQDKWEWSRLCTVSAGTVAQVGFLGPKKIAVLAVHAKGDAAKYELDFSVPGVKVKTDAVPVKEGALPKLKVEGGAASVE